MKSSSFDFSLKTGYGKYIGVDANGFLVAIADAIGARERFEAVFQDVGFTIWNLNNWFFRDFVPSNLSHLDFL